MTEKEFQKEVSSSVQNVYVSNIDAIKNSLVKNISPHMNDDEKLGTLLFNAVNISMHLSVQTAMAILQKLEIVDLENYWRNYPAPELELVLPKEPQIEKP